MKRTVTDCDRCGARAVPTAEIILKVDRTMDAAGSMEDRYDGLDLCLGCLEVAFHLAHEAADLDDDQNAALIKSLRRKP